MGGCEREVCLVAIIYSSLKFTPSPRYKYDALFDSLNPIDGKVTGASAKGFDMESSTKYCSGGEC